MQIKRIFLVSAIFLCSLSAAFAAKGILATDDDIKKLKSDLLAEKVQVNVTRAKDILKKYGDPTTFEDTEKKLSFYYAGLIVARQFFPELKGLLEPLLNVAFQRKTTAEWLEQLGDVSLVAPLYNVAEMINDPHIQARGTIVTLPVPGPKEGVYVKVPNTPVRLSRTPPVVDKPGPGVGEHTRQVLRDVLGLSAQEVERLEQQGVVKSKPGT